MPRCIDIEMMLLIPSCPTQNQCARQFYTYHLQSSSVQPRPNHKSKTSYHYNINTKQKHCWMQERRLSHRSTSHTYPTNTSIQLLVNNKKGISNPVRISLHILLVGTPQ